MTHSYIIYKLTCTVNGKSYIGQTNDLTRRLSIHRSPTSKCIALRNAVQKYGWDCFTVEILAENLELADANTHEARLILEHSTLSPKGYNLAYGGDNKHHSEETKKKISDGNRGKKKPPRTPEYIKKISAAKQGSNNPNFGRPGTMLGRKQTPESIAKRVAARRAKQISEEEHGIEPSPGS